MSLEEPINGLNTTNNLTYSVNSNIPIKVTQSLQYYTQYRYLTVSHMHLLALYMDDAIHSECGAHTQL